MRAVARGSPRGGGWANPPPQKCVGLSHGVHRRSCNPQAQCLACPEDWGNLSRHNSKTAEETRTNPRQTHKEDPTLLPTGNWTTEFQMKKHRNRSVMHCQIKCHFYYLVIYSFGTASREAEQVKFTLSRIILVPIPSMFRVEKVVFLPFSVRCAPPKSRISKSR